MFAGSAFQARGPAMEKALSVGSIRFCLDVELLNAPIYSVVYNVSVYDWQI